MGILDAIGNTPLVTLERIVPHGAARVSAKLEWENPTGCMKDRMARTAIELAEKAGFVLNGSSEINANPQDIKDYPEGVWTLPPTLRLKEQGRETYLGIGESDRFTLRFIKPAE